MTTTDGVSHCRLAPMRDLVFTTPTGKGASYVRWVTPPCESLSLLCVFWKH